MDHRTVSPYTPPPPPSLGPRRNGPEVKERGATLRAGTGSHGDSPNPRPKFPGGGRVLTPHTATPVLASLAAARRALEALPPHTRGPQEVLILGLRGGHARLRTCVEREHVCDVVCGGLQWAGPSVSLPRQTFPYRLPCLPGGKGMRAGRLGREGAVRGRGGRGSLRALRLRGGPPHAPLPSARWAGEPRPLCRRGPDHAGLESRESP